MRRVKGLPDGSDDSLQGLSAYLQPRYDLRTGRRRLSTLGEQTRSREGRDDDLKTFRCAAGEALRS